VDAFSYAVSFAGLLFLRLPGRAAEPATDTEPDASGGVLWVLRHRVIRTTLIWVVVSNLIFSALVIVILAVAGENRAGPSQIGIMMALFGAGGLLGAVLAARLHAALPAPAIVLGFSWIAAIMTATMTLVPGGVALGLILGVVAFFAPVANTTIITYQMMITPDELRGRLSGITGLAAGAAGALGPLLGGILMTGAGGTTGVLICAISLTAVAIGATLNPTLRRFPTLRATSAGVMPQCWGEPKVTS
jgi:predicted MFS family arabinose efflux permease